MKKCIRCLTLENALLRAENEKLASDIAELCEQIDPVIEENKALKAELSRLRGRIETLINNWSKELKEID